MNEKDTVPDPRTCSGDGGETPPLPIPGPGSFSDDPEAWIFEPSAPAPGLDPGVRHVEFGRTSKRGDSRPAIHKVKRDPERGPYFYALDRVSRAPFDARRWDKQNPEKLKARQARYGRADKGRERNQRYEKSEKGRAKSRDRSFRYWASEEGAKAKEKAREAAILAYLDRPIVAIDSEGRCPLHMIDEKRRSPLKAWEEDGVISPYLVHDDAGNYFEPHEMHLIGAQGFDRSHGTPLAEGVRQSAHWLCSPAERGLTTEECFDWLLSLPDKYEGNPVFVMFAAMYDWSMWLKDVPFPAGYSIVKQRAFKPPCKRLQGYQFWKKWAIQMQPHRRLDIGELRWPDDPYGESHRDHPDYEAPKGNKAKAPKGNAKSLSSTSIGGQALTSPIGGPASSTSIGGLSSTSIGGMSSTSIGGQALTSPSDYEADEGNAKSLSSTSIGGQALTSPSDYEADELEMELLREMESVRKGEVIYITHAKEELLRLQARKTPKKLQFLRKIRIYDCFRHSPMSFVKTIKPLCDRGLIAPDVFERIRINKQKRGSFHDESIEDVKQYTSDELHALCVFMHMMRDAYWSAAEIRLKSFHSPASAAGELLRRIGIRGRGNIQGHSWPVKSIDLEHEQLIAHWAYFGGRFECMYKGFFRNTTFNYDLTSAYRYAMQSLPSMAGGRWKREVPDLSTRQFRVDIFKRIEVSSILSIFRVSFGFATDAPFYPLPYRTGNDCILFPQIGHGYYMRDDLLAAVAWCKKFKIDPTNALVIEEANWFHPSDEAERDLKNGCGPFAPVAEVFLKRIEFDKKDPGGPEQLAVKLIINSLYGKLAERIYRGSMDGAPIIPPHISPWYAAAITAHTRRELMAAALLKPQNVIGFATDAIHTSVDLKLPRLKSEADIKKGHETKHLGDWTWKEVPGGLMIQSGLAFFLKSDGSVAEVKCRGLPLKDLNAAKRVADEILSQWRRPYDPDSTFDKVKARAVRVPMQVFMKITSAIVSPRRYKLRGYWGIVSKTIWLDDPGSKRAIGDDERTAVVMEMLAEFPLLTMPRENPSPETISQPRFPDWVENEKKEAARQKRAVAQYHAMFDEDGEPIAFDDTELLLIDNEIIEQ